MMYGPLVLAGRFDPVDQRDELRRLRAQAGDQHKVPDIIADPANPTAWMEPDGKQPLTFHAVGQSPTLDLVPLYKVIHERYAVYWKVNSKTS